jgi:hypothetical protein
MNAKDKLKKQIEGTQTLMMTRRHGPLEQI